MPSISSTTKSKKRADAESVDDMPPLADLIPLAEITKRFGVSQHTGRQWTRSKTTPLRAVRAGLAWLTTEAWVQDWLRRRTAAQEFDGRRRNRP